MAKGLGNNYRLWIESSTAGTYNEIKGGQDLSVTRNGSTIDLSAKSDFPYAAQGPGARAVSISATFLPDLPDALGYTRLETLANATTAAPFNVQVRKGGSAGVTGDTVFQCSVYCTDLNDSFGVNAGVTKQCTFVAAAAPTIDTFAI